MRYIYKKIALVLVAVFTVTMFTSVASANSDATSAKVNALIAMNVVQSDSEAFNDEKLSEPCTAYDVIKIYNICAGITDAQITEAGTSITQGQLAEQFMQLFDIGADEEGAVYTAKAKGIVEDADGFTADDATATNFNLACIAYNCIVYDSTPEDGNTELPVFKTLLETGVLNGTGFAGIESLDNQAMLDTYIYGEKKCEYQTFDGGMDGVEGDYSYSYVNYFGSELLRPYFNQRQWSKDGKSFVCCIGPHNIKNTDYYYLYVYNTDKQTFRYVDTIRHDWAYVVGENDYVYYIKPAEKAGDYQLNRQIIDGTKETEHLFDFPEWFWVTSLQVTNDGKYVSVEHGKSSHAPDRLGYPKNAYPIIRFDTQTGEYTLRYYGFDHSNYATHMAINPVYEDLMFFCHETKPEEGFYYTDIQDRSNIMDMSTGEVMTIPIGLVENTDGSMIFGTHEMWSHNGEYLYITNLGGRADYTPMNGVVRVDKDGTHRQFYYNPLIQSVSNGGWGLGINHANPSGDDKFFACDGSWVYVMSAQTNQVFPICPSTSNARPVFATGKYIMNWTQTVASVSGIAWFDFSEIAAKAETGGGKYGFGNDVTYVDYSEWREGAPELLCDIETTTKNGKTALKANNGKNVYIDINENIVDAVNESVKITFDYYDNSTEPIVLTYTKGVENDNDLCRFENMTKEIARTGSNAWKTAEITIESGNFEDIGTHGTDFCISGSNSEVYVSDISVENLSSEKTPVKVDFSEFVNVDGNYNIKGVLSRTKNTVSNADVIAATYDTHGRLLNVKTSNAGYGSNSVADFNFSLPAVSGEDRISFFIWDLAGGLKSYTKRIDIGTFALNATSAANGVRLTWDAIDGAEEYEIYRDGKRIAVTTNNSYNDKYFTVAEQIDQDVMQHYTTPHNYVIRCGNKVSKSVSACIDASLIKYVIGASDTNVDFGDTAADEYVAVVCAKVDDSGEKTLFSVKNGANSEPEAVGYADMNDGIKIYSAFMGRPTAKSFVPSKNNVFSVPGDLINASDNGGYAAYVFKINACFDSSAEPNLIFTTQEGLTINSVAFIKSENFIY